ncbi:hypothetical protein ABW20_dc0109430 [Dactylellina cionopaga]|nr:hypothetical protein ABW20_dc0109430 [Dactylellina cionopaga]
MKVAFYLIIFAAFAAAAPQSATSVLVKRVSSTSSGKRCGGSSGKKCAKGEACIGEEELKDGIGICIKDPQACDNDKGDKCPSGEWSCLYDPRNPCEAGLDQEECGGGVCVAQQWIQKVGLQTDSPKRCGGPSNKRCADGELCIGDDLLLDEMGVCIKNKKQCANFVGDQCPGKNKYDCVDDPSVQCRPGLQDCGSGACLLKGYGDKIGRRDGSIALKNPKRCGGSSGKECGEYEICTGEEVLKDGMGVCVKNPMNCGNRYGDRCPSSSSKYICANDPRVECKANLKNCGNGLCLFEEYGQRFGIKGNSTDTDPNTKRCGGFSGKKCAKGEFCVGEGDFKDSMGVCAKTTLLPCDGSQGGSCLPGGKYVCLKDPRSVCEAGDENCSSSGVCLLKEYADKVELKIEGPRRCGKTGSKCSPIEVCVGQEESGDDQGFCIKAPLPCGNFLGDTCPEAGKYLCVNDQRIDCPKGVQDCGGGLCLLKEYTFRFGVKEQPKRCSARNKWECDEGGLCVADERGQTKDDLGLCIKNPQKCGNFLGNKCPEGDWFCVTDPRIKCPAGAFDCGGGVCVPGSWAKKYEVKNVTKTTTTKSMTTSSMKSTTTAKPITTTIKSKSTTTTAKPKTTTTTAKPKTTTTTFKPKTTTTKAQGYYDGEEDT